MPHLVILLNHMHIDFEYAAPLVRHQCRTPLVIGIN